MREELIPALGVVCKILDSAHDAGLPVNFALGMNEQGREYIQKLDISKPL